MFALAAAFGAARAFFQPAASALGPMLVPARLLPRAIATNSLAAQLALLLGPALGGLLCAASPVVGYAVCGVLYAAAGACALLIRADTRPTVAAGRSRAAQIREGLAYVWGNKLVFGAISLDLFAVLLGGATGLLPVFARDMLAVGPTGFGVLRSAPGRRGAGGGPLPGILPDPPAGRGGDAAHRRAVRGDDGGVRVLPVVPPVGGCLAVLGGADMVSVYIRQSLIQIATPDRMRGRVAAVSTLFIGASNELGEFESGVAARLLGPVAAVAAGGVGAVAVTAAWAGLFPSLRKADTLA